MTKGNTERTQGIQWSKARAGKHGRAAQAQGAVPRRGPAVEMMADSPHEYDRGPQIIVPMPENAVLCEKPGNEVLSRVSAITVVNLPPSDTKRWVVRRKAIVVAAVRTGAITLEEACRRYELSVEEFFTWQRAIEMHGIPGLRVTRLQIYRDPPPARPGSGATEHPAGNRRFQ